MIIDELVLHNFGVYRGRQRFDLSIAPGRPIVLIGALNGNGKTTFLDALQLVFYGKVARCSGRNGVGYEDYLRRSINRSVSPEEGAAIEVSFRQTSGAEESTYRLHRSWSVRGSSLRETFNVIKDGAEDHVLTENWQEYLEELLPSRIAPLFFFDGEKIEEFADPKTSANILSSAIHALLGLDIVERLDRDLEVLERRKKSARMSDSDREKIEREIAGLREYETALTSLRERRATINTEAAQAQKRVKEAQSTFSLQGGDAYNRREELRATRDEKGVRVAELERQLRAASADVLPLTLVRDLLNDVVKQDEQERSSERAEAVLGIIDNRDRALLSLLGEESVQPELVSRVDHFLKTERKNFEKIAATERYINLTNEGRLELTQLINNAMSAVPKDADETLKHVKSACAELNVLDRQLASVPAAEIIQELSKAVDEAQARCSELMAALEAIDREIAGAERALAAQRSAVAKLFEVQVRAVLDQEDLERLLRHSSKVKGTLARFRGRVVRHHLARLEELILECLCNLMRKDQLIAEVSIDAETFAIELRGADGRSLSPERLSAGERQLFAVALLWALGKASGRPAPTIIDTPLGRLDSVHRGNLVERYFPEASHQVILLSTDEEIDSVALESLGPKVSRRYIIEYDPTSDGSVVSDGYFFEEAA